MVYSVVFVVSIDHTTVCPGSSDQFYIVTYYIKWVTTSWTYSMYIIIVVQRGERGVIPPWGGPWFKACLQSKSNDWMLFHPSNSAKHFFCFNYSKLKTSQNYRNIYTVKKTVDSISIIINSDVTRHCQWRVQGRGKYSNNPPPHAKSRIYLW